jgi:hypothetical protein
MKKVLIHIRSNLIAYVALFFALSGSAAYAAGHIYSADIVDGQVFSVDVADENLTGLDVRNGGLTGADIADNNLGSADIQNLTGSDVWDNSLTGADVSNGSLTGVDVWDNSLTGADVAENTLSVANMGCQSGKILGFARIHGKAMTQDGVAGWTSNPKYVDIVNNCSGGRVEVFGGVGGYEVRFVGNPALLALVSVTGASTTDEDNIISVRKYYDYFAVQILDICGKNDTNMDCEDGTQNQSGDFTIVLP